uniref:Uncharacterized protein n=1 Tax=Hanusia phi TaxID=3032 RepID=A0A7S0HBQ1_9CRYP|mmetsp:Transcript_11935/g.27570  ORF Transcript_11935/g.27570 Transcript_11935/m.27570 type:complete len:348 (+) Transcript_11935:184-1227(+)
MAKGVRIGGETVRIYEPDFVKSVQEKLVQHERGLEPSGSHGRTRKISYVQSNPNRVLGGRVDEAHKRISDLVIPAEYDEDGRVVNKGKIIVKGVTHELSNNHKSVEALNKNIALSFEILDEHPAKRVSFKIKTAELPLDPNQVLKPSELANKVSAPNEPVTRTRTEASNWLETHQEGLSHTWIRSTLKIEPSMMSLKLPLFSPEPCEADIEAAMQANDKFRKTRSFADQDERPMSSRRSTAGQSPVTARIRRNPLSLNPFYESRSSRRVFKDPLSSAVSHGVELPSARDIEVRQRTVTADLLRIHGEGNFLGFRTRDAQTREGHKPFVHALDLRGISPFTQHGTLHS